MTPHVNRTYFQGRLGDVLRTSWGRPKTASQERPSEVRLGRPLDVRLGRPQDVISRRSQDVRSGRPRDVSWGQPRDGEVEYLGDILGANICWLGCIFCLE